jgi:hypothetical protein
MLLLPTILAHAEEPAPLIMEPWAFALTAAIFFALIAFVTHSYRDVANRHADRVPPPSVADDHRPGGH